MSQTDQVESGDGRCPAAGERHLGPFSPDTVATRGNREILQRFKLALFLSRRCPGRVVRQTYDLAQQWRDTGVTVIGGFHSPMERECLRILLNSPHPVIVCPARGLPRRLPPEFHRPLADGRLLLLAPFPETVRRADEDTARQRNRFVAALADAVFVAYAAPGSHTESFAREIAGCGKRLFTFDGPAHQNLLALGARPWTARSLDPPVAEEEVAG
jgi:predicted Rossmann fold nucleotide-binding protein DprA/Smf involved in DNA uptake